MSNKAICARLDAVARVAKAQGDKEAAAYCKQVAQWARIFSGWQSRPIVGPAAPSIGCLYADSINRALVAAARRGEDNRLAMALAYQTGIA